MRIISSRMSGGNFLYPAQLELEPDRVVFHRNTLFSRYERAIPYSKIASVSAIAGAWFAAIRIESSGGSEDIVADGFSKAELKAFRDTLQAKISEQTEIPRGQNLKVCPYCAENIQAAAIKCRYCGEMLAS